MNWLLKGKNWATEIPQEKNLLASKTFPNLLILFYISYYLNSTPRTHMVGEETKSHKLSSGHTHAHKQNL